MDKRRQSKFSFSRIPVESNSCGSAQTQSSEGLSTLQQWKSRLKCKRQYEAEQLAQVIDQVEQPGSDSQARRFLQRQNLELTNDELACVRFDMREYHELYVEGEILGEGCIGLVKSVTRKSDGQEFACKTVKTDSEEIVKNMINEFRNLRKLKHENIVQMEVLYVQWNDGFQANGTVCVVMEKINGKEMFEVIQKENNYSESTARILFTQILQAIQYMHSNYCCHRDLKPNNILCLQNGNSIKIADFNVSKFSDNYKEFGNLNEHGKIEMWTYTGTVAFSAPEIFSGAIYNEQVDLWSAGVILYVMLSGKLPFDSQYLNDLIDKICSCKYDFSGETWELVSDQAKDLIQNLLQHDPAKRLTPEQALAHPWITKECSDQNLPREQLSRNVRRLLSVRPTQIAKNREQKMRQICFLFGAGDIWKRHSLGYNTSATVAEDFRKFKSIDIAGSQPTNKITVVKDNQQKGLFHISGGFSSSDSD